MNIIEQHPNDFEINKYNERLERFYYGYTKFNKISCDASITFFEYVLLFLKQ